MKRERMKLEFKADSFQVRGPKGTDQSYTVVFNVGEYERENVAKLMVLPSGVNLKVGVEVEV